MLLYKCQKEPDRRGAEMELNEMWDKLMELGVSEQTLQIVTDINGYNKRTMHDVLYAFAGENTFEGEEDEEDED